MKTKWTEPIGASSVHFFPVRRRWDSREEYACTMVTTGLANGLRLFFFLRYNLNEGVWTIYLCTCRNVFLKNKVTCYFREYNTSKSIISDWFRQWSDTAHFAPFHLGRWGTGSKWACLWVWDSLYWLDCVGENVSTGPEHYQ